MQDPTTAAAFRAIVKQQQPPPPSLPPQFAEQEQIKCPRCDSTNTKFCYYNNYNLSQPRHFCKNCRRYWTKGGSLRNVPVGGGTRKNNTSTTKRSSKRPNPDADSDPGRSNRRVTDPTPSPPPPTTLPSLTSTLKMWSGRNSTQLESDSTRNFGLEIEQEGKLLDMNGSFSSLLESSGQFGNIFDGLRTSGSGLKMVQTGGLDDGLSSGVGSGFSSHGSGLNVQGGSGNSENGGGGSGSNGRKEAETTENYLQLQSSDWGGSNGWPNLAIYTPGPGFQ